MIRSIAKLNTILKPDETYIWHTALIATNSRARRIWMVWMVLLCLASIAGCMYLAIGITMGVMVLFHLNPAGGAWILFASLIACAIVVPHGINSLTASRETLVLTDRRVVRLNKRMVVVDEFAYDKLSLHYTLIGLALHAEQGETGIKWDCIANPAQAKHLAGHLGVDLISKKKE
jgi:hypothetical protein